MKGLFKYENQSHMDHIQNGHKWLAGSASPQNLTCQLWPNWSYTGRSTASIKEFPLNGFDPKVVAYQP